MPVFNTVVSFSSSQAWNMLSCWRRWEWFLYCHLGQMKFLSILAPRSWGFVLDWMWNYELKLCVGIFFLCLVLIFKIIFQWVIFPCCVCIINKAHLNPGLFFFLVHKMFHWSWNPIIYSLSRIKLTECFQKSFNFIFHLFSVKLTCVFLFLLSLVEQDKATRVLASLMTFIVVLRR